MKLTDTHTHKHSDGNENKTLRGKTQIKSGLKASMLGTRREAAYKSKQRTLLTWQGVKDSCLLITMKTWNNKNRPFFFFKNNGRSMCAEQRCLVCTGWEWRTQKRRNKKRGDGSTVYLSTTMGRSTNTAKPGQGRWLRLGWAAIKTAKGGKGYYRNQPGKTDWIRLQWCAVEFQWEKRESYSLQVRLNRQKHF